MVREIATCLYAVLMLLAVGKGQASAEVPSELVTAPRAILCLSPSELPAAVQPLVSRDQQRLRKLRCMRIESGVPLTLMTPGDALNFDAPWQVNLRPQGIRGVTVWGYPSAFALPDGTGIALQNRRHKSEKPRPARSR
jgi:hypothetical protein